MTALDEARRKIEARRQQQAQNSGSNDLWFRENDMVIAHFLCTGGEGDPYFDTYVAHEYPAKAQGGWPTLKYCPVESGHDENYDCQGCREGMKTKDRMIMWFWVYDILHATLKQGETLPQVPWMNKMWFRREVNGPKLWDTSAWRESPLDDILMLGGQLGNLQAMRMNLMTTGSGLTKRFKIYAEPNTGSIDPAHIQAAQDTIRPIVDVLRERLEVVPSVPNPSIPVPNGSGQPYVPGGNGTPEVQPYVPGGGAGSVPAYVPGGGAPAPEAPPAAPAAKKTPAKKKMF